MYAIRQELLPASGVEFSTSLLLTPSTLEQNSAAEASGSTLPPSVRHAVASRVLFNLVVARSNLLRIFEVREHVVPISLEAEKERERNGKVRRGTEPVEGEVEMDESGEGFVNVGGLKVNAELVFVVGVLAYANAIANRVPPLPKYHDGLEVLTTCPLILVYATRRC